VSAKISESIFLMKKESSTTKTLTVLVFSVAIEDFPEKEIKYRH